MENVCKCMGCGIVSYFEIDGVEHYPIDLFGDDCLCWSCYTCVEDIIEPTKITDYSRSDAELEAFWIFCIMVAGRNSDFAAKKVGDMLRDKPPPFEFFQSMMPNGVRNYLEVHKVGQYNRINRAIVESLKLDLRTCSLKDLVSVHGVGFKTACFFLLHSRKGSEVCVLDTHILRYLRENGFALAPKTSPQKIKDYEAWGEIWATVRKKRFPHLSAADADLLVWTLMSGRLKD